MWPFLKLSMPIDESLLPSPRIFQAGRNYKIPFKFVVPYQLAVGTCNHDCSFPVQDQHLWLPPTLGHWEATDFSPDVTKIGYHIRVAVLQNGGPHQKQIKVMDSQRMINVIPAFPEEPPLNIIPADERFRSVQTEVVRKSALSHKTTGVLTALTSQPSAIMMGVDRNQTSRSTARIRLDFTPLEETTIPPRFKCISAEIIANTFFGASMLNHIPNLGTRVGCQQNPTLNYTVKTPIFSQSLDGLPWRRVNRGEGAKGNNLGAEKNVDDLVEFASLSEGPGEHDAHPGSPGRYTSEIEVPLMTPRNGKIFLPTFHSCQISRTYTLQLRLSGKSGVKIKLAVPLQIGVETEGSMRCDGPATIDGHITQEERAQAPPGHYMWTTLQSESLLPDYDE